MSYTILPYLQPTQEAQDILNMQGVFLAQPNTFSAVQNFDSQINCTSATFSAAVSTGALTANGLASLRSGLFVEGIVQLPDGTINQSEVLHGYVDLLNAQTVAGVKSFSSPPVMSGSTIEISTIPAASIVDKSITDSQLTLAGISQSSILNGYMDLATDQYIIGNKEFAGATRFLSGITNLGSSALQEVQCTMLYASDIAVNNNVSALTFTGSLNGNAATCSIATNIIVQTDNTSGSFAIPFIKTSVGNDAIFVDDAATPFMTYNPSSGLFTSSEITASSIARLNNVILPTSFTVCSNVLGVLSIPLGGFSLGNFSHTMAANITSVSFSGLVVGSRSVLVLTGGAVSRSLSKALSSGGVTVLNSLSGNTNVAAGSTFICNIFVISPTLVSMVFSNVT